MNNVITSVLDRLEQREARLLAWGIVDGAFTDDELRHEVDSILGDDGDIRAVIDELEDRRLLFRGRRDGERTWRTRMAETVRLASRLRQLFPGRDWRTSPTLVGDFRFSVRPRVYPARDQGADWLLAAVEKAVAPAKLDDLTRRAMLALIDRGDGTTFDLGKFQVEAAASVLAGVAGPGRISRGTVVGAGTGTGKTLAFYLPALAHLAALAPAAGTGAASGTGGPKALALYPRQELLKDQFDDAYHQCRKLDALLRQVRRRPLVVGAWFHSTPFAASGQTVKWPSGKKGQRSPYLRCRACKEQPSLEWRDGDLKKGREVLRCPACEWATPEGTLRLTRQSIQRDPPDVLFTTTDSLNLQMGNGWSARAFGVGADRPPRLVLLDEIHIQSGVAGAQTALLLRRWREMARGNGPAAKVHFVGLSATLPNAGEFFADLVGLPATRIDAIVPPTDAGHADVRVEGAEYLMALRGDPASATSLLAASIQTTMLMGRMLDLAAAPGDGPSRGLYGRKVFAFTDDLDVTHRLHDDFADAEGRGWRDKPPRQLRQGWPLAVQRAARGESEDEERARLGQAWHAVETIGHRLDDPHAARLRVGRVASQDPGLDSLADVVVATASLEVGFDDPQVGAVIQHKAPRDAASFLQRRGRAGRPRGMRPWTVVVLSDYGRDREAYQHYDLLFDAQAPRRRLPIENRYILKMQGTFALMDYFARNVHAKSKASVRQCFAAPADAAGNQERAVAEWQGLICNGLQRLLDDDIERGRLAAFLRRSLQIDEAEVEAIFWDAPRPLMTAVIPTALRRLESGWHGEIPTRSHPLPEFVPENLFTDLCLPEVVLATRLYEPDYEARLASSTPLLDEHVMPVGQALTEFPPGRASRRFGVRSEFDTHWFPIPLDEVACEVDVTAYCPESDEAGTYQVDEEDGVADVRVVRPKRIEAARLPKLLRATSNARPRWRSQLTGEGEAIDLIVPEGPWSSIVPRAQVYAHRHGGRVRVRRFTVGANATLKFREGTERDVDVTFTAAGGRGGVGFAEKVDGVRFDLSPPEKLTEVFAAEEMVGRSSRSAFFRHVVLTDHEAALHSFNVFRRGWLHQVFAAGLIRRSIQTGDIRFAAKALSELDIDDFADEMDNVLSAVFQALPEAEDHGDEDDGTARRQRVHDDLRDAFADADVRERLVELAAVLWQPEGDARWQRWLERRWVSTAGHALLAACLALAPTAGEGDLLLDVDPGPPAVDDVDLRDPSLRPIWITESNPGGTGIVEEVLRGFAADPRRYFSIATAAAGKSELEVADAELSRVARLSVEDDGVANAFSSVRAAQGIGPLAAANKELRTLLTAQGVRLTHAVASGLQARLLRPMTSAATDRLIANWLDDWDALEAKLNCEVELPTFAYRVAGDESTLQALRDAAVSAAGDRAWAYSVAYGLLWPRGGSIRRRALSAYNRFAELPEPDPAVLRSALAEPEAEVDVDHRDWLAVLHARLATSGFAQLVARSAGGSDHAARLRRAIIHAVVAPVDVGFLNVYPLVDGIDSGPGGSAARVRLREVEL